MGILIHRAHGFQSCDFMDERKLFSTQTKELIEHIDALKPDEMDRLSLVITIRKMCFVLSSLTQSWFKLVNTEEYTIFSEKELKEELGFWTKMTKNAYTKIAEIVDVVGKEFGEDIAELDSSYIS